MKLTVAICTWNRATLLRETLAHLGEATPPKSPWELIVVDNNCTDETASVVDEFSARLPIRYINEPKQGLSYARNAAIKAASGKYIIWTDDDVLVDSKWLTSYEQAIVRRPDASVFGGPVHPWFEGTPPAWITENWDLFANAFATRDLGKDEIPLDRNAYPFGANFAVRTTEQRAHLFDPKLGRLKSGGALGEESAVIRSILSDGGTGWWIPDARVKHWLPKARQSLDYIREYYFLAGRTQALALQPGCSALFFGLPAWLIRERLLAELSYAYARIASRERNRLQRMVNVFRLRGLCSSYRAGK